MFRVPNTTSTKAIKAKTRNLELIDRNRNIATDKCFFFCEINR
jgi:hypothetical protein